MDIFEVVRQSNPKFTKVKTRNILLIGDSRAGKSTLMNTISEGVKIVSQFKIYSETLSTNKNSRIIEHENDNLTLHIIDTPGLKERVIKNEDIELEENEHGGFQYKLIKGNEKQTTERTDEDLMKSILYFLQDNVNSLNLVCFVYDLNKGISKESCDTLIKFISYLPQIKDICCLIFTKCEKFEEFERKKILLEFMKTNLLYPYTFNDIFKKRYLFFCGAIDPFIVKISKTNIDKKNLLMI